jgi:hypothetical protein
MTDSTFKHMNIGHTAQAHLMISRALVNVARCCVVLLPWRLRRYLLIKWWGYEFAPTSYIGVAWVFSKRLIRGEYSEIRSLAACRNVDLVHLEEHAIIGRFAWITGYPKGDP